MRQQKKEGADVRQPLPSNDNEYSRKFVCQTFVFPTNSYNTFAIFIAKSKRKRTFLDKKKKTVFWTVFAVKRVN